MRSLARLLVVLFVVSICATLAADATSRQPTLTLLFEVGYREVYAACDGPHRLYIAKASGGSVGIAVIPNGCASMPPPTPAPIVVRQHCRNRVGAVIPCVEAVQ